MLKGSLESLKLAETLSKQNVGKHVIIRHIMLILV